MAKKKLRSSHLHPQFSAAVKEFGLKFLKSQSITHRGNRGTAREEALLEFLSQNLPNRYSVAEGEITDLAGKSSPQMDIIIYDGIEDTPFKSGSSVILAAEAALVTIEVKSKISAQEILKSIEAAKKLRELRPFNKSLAGSDIQAEPSDAGQARYFHCVFAYDSDLTKDNWLSKEFGRIQEACESDHLIDAVYVLERGLIQMNGKKGREEDDDGGAISNLYFSILNFVQREGKRRKQTPYELYTKPQKNAWTEL